ncbi:DUF3068 domain-containing protein [Aeromicrobium sp. A1-2]|uniref:DUF3068 domain-containing protein n=1 Tax=Aeromicrobium sp. A1-2 TaxID=2107713 RepID=UPI0013C33D49|nr:DUF3068 domain-containing protein [Aeromicrobium sp. A1-2]
MGKKLGTVALFLGAFLLALAALSKFYMYDQLAVVPYNTETTNTSSTAPGNDAEYLDAAAGLKITTGPLKNTKVLSGNVELSKKASKDLGKDVAVWDYINCTAPVDFNCGSGDTPLSLNVDRVPFDRNTGQTVRWDGSYSETGGEKTEPANFEGLYFKFPFDTQKKTYKFWDDTLLTSTDAKFVGEGKVEGLKVYKFEQTIAPISTGTIDVPGDLVGSDESTVTADQIYSSTSYYSVEPVTGVIIVGRTSQDSYLEVDGVRKVTTTKADLQYSDATIKDTADEYKSKATLLTTVKTTVPLGGALIGILLIAAGLWTRRGGDTSGSRKADKDELIGSH